MKKKVDVLFVICPFWSIKYPHIGVAYLSSYLRSKNITTEVLDCNIEIYNIVDKNFKKKWIVKTNFDWKDHTFLEKYINLYCSKILEKGSNLIAFSMMASNQLFALRLIEKLKIANPKLIIITGGSGPHIKESSTIDYHVLGEAEEKLYQLVKRIKNRGEFSDIPRIIEYNNGKGTITKGHLFTNINDLPFPTYSEFDLNQYESKNLVILGSRGCIQKCVFCNDWPVWKYFRQRKAEKIVEEIKYHVLNNEICSFEFGDLLINGHMHELKRMCQLLIDENLDIQWSSNAIIREEMTPEILNALKKSGCGTLTYGFESGSDRVVKSMGKKFTYQQSSQVFKDTHSARIKVSLNIMVGFPGETEEDFNKTKKFIHENHMSISSVSGVSMCFVLPNSTLDKNPEMYGLDISMNNYYYLWKDNQGNTYDLRMRKLNELVDIISYYKIPIIEVKKIDIPKDHNNPIMKNKNAKEKKIPKLTSLYLNFLNKRIYHEKSVIREINQKKSRVTYGPKYVVIDITNKCNLNCIACWTYSPMLKENKPDPIWFKQELSYETLKDLIKDLAELKTQEIRLTGGGEPFIHPEIMKIIELIKKSNIKLDITTNFTLVKNRLDYIANYVDNITISLWAATPETYVKTHPNQSEKTFESIKKNLLYFNEINQKTKIVIANVISNLNYNEIDKMMNYAIEVSADEVYFTLVDPVEGETKSLLLNQEQQEILINKFRKIYEKYQQGDYGKIIIDNPDIFLRRISNKDGAKGFYDSNIIYKIPCTVGWTFTRIMANGDVAPCCKAVMLPTGNINKQSFKNIWNDYKQRTFRKIGLNLKAHPRFVEKVGCEKTCDNLMHNIEMYNKIRPIVK